MTDDELRTRLAEIEHIRWADWQLYVHSQLQRYLDCWILPDPVRERWKRQIATPYADLTTAEQRSDMEQVDRRYWPLIEPILRENERLWASKSGEWHCTRNGVTEPCGDCDGCRWHIGSLRSAKARLRERERQLTELLKLAWAITDVYSSVPGDDDHVLVWREPVEAFDEASDHLRRATLSPAEPETP